jgi:hypothetical protein
VMRLIPHEPSNETMMLSLKCARSGVAVANGRSPCLSSCPCGGSRHQGGLA